MKRKNLLLCVIFMLMTGFFTLSVSAAPFAGGKGTKSDPYKVSNYTQLMKVKDYNGKYFKQTKDINYKYKKISSLFSEGGVLWKLRWQ